MLKKDKYNKYIIIIAILIVLLTVVIFVKNIIILKAISIMIISINILYFYVKVWRMLLHKHID